nr:MULTISPECIES: hypothetical protein [unclassified Mesorhizobium]
MVSSASARRRRLAAAAVVNDVLAPRLVGRDAFDIAGAEQACLPLWTGVQSINDRTRIILDGEQVAD